MSAVFKGRQPVNSRIELPGHTSRYYLSGGLRRVYSTGSWSEQWRNWSKRNGSIDANGSYLTCVRPYHNGKQREYYVDMSVADIDISHMESTPLQWDIDISTDPSDSQYLRTHRLGQYTLREVAHMPTSDFLRLVNSLGRQVPHGRKK